MVAVNRNYTTNGLNQYNSAGPATFTYDANGMTKGRFQYTGQIWIPELGMYHYKSRIYSPTGGRFMQVDPIGYDDQINLYAYVGDDPINKTDPSGNETCVGTPQQCAAYNLSLSFAMNSSDRSVRNLANKIDKDQKYIIMFASRKLIDYKTDYRGFAYTNITKKGTIYTVLPENFSYII